MEGGDIRIPVRCDCGREFDVSIAGVELDQIELTCPGCGEVSRFSAEEIALIEKRAEALCQIAPDVIRDILQSDGGD